MDELCLEPALLRPGHRVELLIDGARAYPRMIEAIHGARSSVFLEMYTIADDAAGRRFADALIGRAAAGVDVRVLYDSAGSRDTPREFFGAMRAGGVKVVEFHPLSGFWRGFRFRRRNHRKLVVVDGRTAFLGGINIANAYAAAAEGGLGWRDTNIEIEGPVVTDLAAMFLELWGRREAPPAPPPATDGARALAIGSQRFRDRWRIARTYRHAIRHARERVWIANPYFLPSRPFRRALRQARSRGADVRILVPSRTDFAPVLHASRRLFLRHLRAGLRIFEWPGPMMHAKTAVVDGVWSTVGSYNIDRRSLFHNYELTAVVADRAFGRRMEEMFEADVARSREITLDEWRRRGWKPRLLERFFYQFRSLF